MNWPDRRPKPEMWEHRRLAAPMAIGGSPADVRGGRVELVNRQDFTDLGWLTGSYELTVAGEPVAGGEIELPALGPGERALVSLPGWMSPTGSGEAWLTIRFRTPAELSWATQGLEICALQVPVAGATATLEGAAVAPDADSDGPELDAEGRLVHPMLATPPELSL